MKVVISTFNSLRSLKVSLLKEELECHTYRNEIRKIMIYGIAECVHKTQEEGEGERKVESNKKAKLLLWFFSAVGFVFVAPLGFSLGASRFVLINKYSAQTGGHGIVLKLLWCLSLFWFCFYTFNDLFNWNEIRGDRTTLVREWERDGSKGV